MVKDMLLARKLNLVYNINGQKYANMLKFFRGIFWEAAFFQRSLYGGYKIYLIDI